MTSRQRLVIAGGLASGKSAVGLLLRDWGWAVVDTDEIGRAALLDETIVRAILRRWPETLKSGVVDRSLLAKLVFADPDQLAVLESLVHPVVGTQVDSWLETAGPRTAVEVSVLRVLRPEWGKLVVVSAPVRLRIQRAIERGMNAEDAMERIRAQPTNRDLLARADVVIDNSGSKAALAEAVRRLVQVDP